MSPTKDWLLGAKDEVGKILDSLQPTLMSGYGLESYEDKPDNSIVTELDKLVEITLKDKLAKLDGSIGFSGEETGHEGGKQTFWLVDPIDGTEQFVRGVPHCTNLVALISGGEIVMGIVNAFAENKRYWAVKDGGAFCGEAKIRVNDRPTNRAMLELETNVTTAAGQAMFSAVRETVWAYVQLVAPGYMMAQVASGKYEGRMHYRGYGHIWDFAAGSILISEAGGKVGNIGSDKFDYSNLDQIAASPQVFDKLQEIATRVASQF